MTRDQLQSVAELAQALKRNKVTREKLKGMSSHHGVRALVKVGDEVLVGRTQTLAMDAVLASLDADDAEIMASLAGYGITLD